MKQNRLFIFCCCLLVFMATSVPASPGRFAYVLRYDHDDKGAHEFLVKFDVNKDEIVRNIPLPLNSGYNNFLIDEQVGCFIAKYRTPWRYGREVLYFDPEKKKIDTFISFKDLWGPRYMILTEKDLIVEVRGNDESRLKSGIVFIDRKSKKVVKRLFIRENEPSFSQANINDLFFDGKNLLFFSSFYIMKDKNNNIDFSKDAVGDVYVVDVRKKEIVKILNIPHDYKTIDGVCSVGDKVYVAAAAKGERSLDGWVPPNEELLVYSFETGKLIKKIKIDGHPYKLTCDQSVGKLYVQHMDDKVARNTVEVIDIKTDKVINRLQIPSQLMFSVVKPGKMYITVGKMMLTPSRTAPALLVLDTKTDKIIKKFPGAYYGISEDARH